MNFFRMKRAPKKNNVFIKKCLYTLYSACYFEFASGAEDSVFVVKIMFLQCFERSRISKNRPTKFLFV